jgi:putative transposase
MLMDADKVAASPTTIYRVLRDAGRLDRWAPPPSHKGDGFTQPLQAHQHWHIDIAYLNLAGTFYYLCSILDGFSRFIVHWEIQEQMKEADVELILQRGLEKHPGAKPRAITDNGPQFLARDFHLFIRLCGMTHVRTSPYYPQSNGKIERWHRTLKSTTIRPKCPESLEEANDVVTAFVDDYNHERLHSAIGYVTPADKLAGRAEAIWALRIEKLEAARERRAAATKNGSGSVRWSPLFPSDDRHVSVEPVQRSSAGGRSATCWAGWRGRTASTARTNTPSPSTTSSPAPPSVRARCAPR